MNVKSFRLFNRFKELVSTKKEPGWEKEIEIFSDIKNAEDMDIADLLKYGRRFVLIGVVDPKFSHRPIVCNYAEGSDYPKPEKIAFFPQIDLLQDIIEMQDTIDIVTDPKIDLAMVEHQFDDDFTLLNVEVVYGKACKKAKRVVPQLTLAEVVSQLAPRYHSMHELAFYVCDPAEECGNLTRAGYHAYRVAVYKPAQLSEDELPDLSVDGIFSE